MSEHSSRGRGRGRGRGRSQLSNQQQEEEATSQAQNLQNGPQPVVVLPGGEPGQPPAMDMNNPAFVNMIRQLFQQFQQQNPPVQPPANGVPENLAVARQNQQADARAQVGRNLQINIGENVERNQQMNAQVNQVNVQESSSSSDTKEKAKKNDGEERQSKAYKAD